MGSDGIPVAEQGMELDDEVGFVLLEVPSLNIRPEVVDPSEPATLTAPKQPYEEGKRSKCRRIVKPRIPEVKLHLVVRNLQPWGVLSNSLLHAL